MRAGARGPLPGSPGPGLPARRWPPHRHRLRPQPGARDAGLDRLSSGHFGLSFQEEGFILGLWWSYFSSVARKRMCGCRWTIAGGLQGEGALTPGAGRRGRRFRSHLETGDRSSEKRELFAPSLGHAGAPAVTSAGLARPCPPLPDVRPAGRHPVDPKQFII